MSETVSYLHTKYIFEKFQKHVYNTEDTLYQILYDKSNRPEVYWSKIHSTQSTDDSFGL